MSSYVEADLGRPQEVDASAPKQGDIPGGRATEDEELCLTQQVEHLQNRLARAEAQSDAYLRAQESRLELEAHRQNSQLQTQVLALESEIQRMSFQRMRDENDVDAAKQDEITMLRTETDRLKSEAFMLEERLRVSDEQLAGRDLRAAAREEQLTVQLQRREAETAASRMAAGEATSQLEEVLGECDALRRTCDKLSSENASNSGENMSW